MSQRIALGDYRIITNRFIAKGSSRMSSALNPLLGYADR